MRRAIIFCFAPTLASLAACNATSHGETTAVQGQGVVDPENPVFTAPSTADLPALSVTGTFAQVGPSGAPAATGQYTALTDLDLDPSIFAEMDRILVPVTATEAYLAK